MGKADQTLVTAAKEKVEDLKDHVKASVVPPAESKEQRTKAFLHTPLMRAALPFINGGLSGMTATAIIQPIDMIKVRIQLAPSEANPTFLNVFREVRQNEGFFRLYNGLSAGLLRQGVYTTARLGFFDKFQESLKKRAQAKGRELNFWDRAIAAAGAGGLAAAIGNPADLALIRMQSDGLKPIAQRQNYRSVVDALTRIVRNEGFTTLWSGAYPTVVRAMTLNLGQLATFSEAKARLDQWTNWGTVTKALVSSAFAGFASSALSLPADFIKTRLQKQGRDGEYKGMWDCTQKTWQREGMRRFYRGFWTYYVRIAPHAMITLLIQDVLKTLTK